MYTIFLGFFVIASLYSLNYLHSRSTYLLIVRFYFAVEYAMFMLFFSSLINNTIFKKIGLLSIVPFWLYCIYNFFTSESDTFNIYPAIIEFSIFILVLIFYFYEKMKVVSKFPLYQSISFWLCVGLFIYFTGNLFYLLFITSTNDKHQISQMQIIYSCVTIAKNLIIAFAWLAHERLETNADILQMPDDMQLDDDFIVSNQTNS